jgi:alkylated DNA repair dioxygenase AlkB
MIPLLFPIENAPVPDISGLSYCPDFITSEEEAFLISAIDSYPWIHDLKRRVQHYGYRYDYKSRQATKDTYIGPLPDWILPIAQKLTDDKKFSTLPEQVIVNEYLPGQGISAHIDCVPCFGNVIASLSLGSPCIMKFENIRLKENRDLFLAQRSLTVFRGEARHQWTHAIPERKSDTVNGIKIPRSRRISLTFRTMIF